MDKIHNIINSTPEISDIRKSFYIRILDARKELIIDRAYQCCKSKEYDREAFRRLSNGIGISEKDAKDFVKKGTIYESSHTGCN